MNYWLNILALMGIYAILAMSLNVICGMTGLLQLGHAGFFAVGAYVAGLLAIYATVPELGPFNLALGCLSAMTAAAIFAIVIGLPCLRLRGDYLAIATLGFGEIVRMVLTNIEFPGCPLTGGEKFGGATGIRLPDPRQYAINYSAAYASWPIILAAVAVTYVLLLNLKRSYIGRAMMCIREDEIAARAMGIHVPRYKMLAFLISAIFAGLAGGLFAHNQGLGIALNPGDFSLLRTVDILVIVVLGGLGSVTGALAASVLLVLLPAALDHLPNWVQWMQDTFVFMPEFNAKQLSWLSEHHQLLYAVLLIVLIRLVPNGLLGLREWPRKKCQVRNAKCQMKEEPKVLGSSAFHLALGTRHLALPQSPFFSATDLVKHYGGLVAVDRVSIRLDQGQIVGLIGPNGAGKTTVFNLITGLERPDSGHVTFAGRDLTGRPAHIVARAGIARTFQNIRLAGELSVLDNVKIACHRHAGYGLLSAVLRLPRFYTRERAMTRQAMEMLEMFDLHGLGGEPAASLPYGKKRNLEIARALVTESKLLLLDEPAAGLNPKETADLAGLIRRIRDQFGVTILLIEHDMRMVMSLCEQIVVLDDGKEIATGSPQQVRRNVRVVEAYLGPSRAEEE